MVSVVYTFSLLLLLLFVSQSVSTEEVPGCSGIIQSDYFIDFSAIKVNLYDKDRILKYTTECAPVDGYFFIPLTDLERREQIIFIDIITPYGWNFAEYSWQINLNFKDDICTTGKDLVFVFTGFNIEGRVISYGTESGPKGVKIKLFKNGELIQTSKSEKGGYFEFRNVTPDKYSIRATHDDFNVSKKEFNFELTADSVDIGSQIDVFGYKVTGFVYHEKMGISDVQILLLTAGNSNAFQSEDCKKSIDSLVGEVKLTPYLLCVAVTREDGMFNFNSVSPGEYTIKPYYKSARTKFQLKPSLMKTAISHSSVKLKDQFEVTGFEVFGNVINLGINGELLAIQDVEIEMKRNKVSLKTISDKFGSFYFNEISSGAYTVTAKLSGYEFEEILIDLSPSQTEIPTLFPSKFEVSGKFELAKLSLKNEFIRDIKVDFFSSNLYQTEVNSDLSFTILLPKATYQCTPNLSKELKLKGVSFKPESTELTVSKHPISNVLFSQILSAISVEIHCSDSCGILNTILTDLSSQMKLTESVSSNDVTAMVQYSDLLPGEYRVELEETSRCWEEKLVSVSIGSETGKVDFYQTGFKLDISCTHEAKIEIQHSLGKYQNTELIQKGQNNFCLPVPGVYKITPISCHRFDPKEILFDTSQSLNNFGITAVSHQTKTHILADNSDIRNGEIKLRVTTLSTGRFLTIEPGSITNNNNNNNNNTSLLEFDLFVETGEELLLEPKANQLLFLPPTFSVQVSGDTCPVLLATFTANRGTVIRGRVLPPIAGVAVELKIDSPALDVLSTHTNVDGEFSFGPLPKLERYEVTPNSPGLFFERREDNLFLVRRMGRVVVSVLDEQERPLSAVLVSMHCGKIRMNNMTRDSGVLHYSQLHSCEYYVKPSLKEYSFFPSGETVSVEFDTESEVRFVGRKIHYSAYGSVTSLNGRPQWSIEVLARGISGGCGEIAEKGSSDLTGAFRIQGLKPNCQYRISVETRDSPRVENVLPGSYLEWVYTEDIKGVHFQLYNRTEEHELTGGIEGPEEAMDRMQVKLYQETPRGLVHISNIQVGAGGFFKYSLSRGYEEKEFVLMVDSKSRMPGYSVYSDQSAVSFVEGARHTTVGFRVEKINDIERSGGSFFQLTLALVVIFVVTRFSRLIRESFRKIFGK